MKMSNNPAPKIDNLTRLRIEKNKIRRNAGRSDFILVVIKLFES